MVSVHCGSPDQIFVETLYPLVSLSSILMLYVASMIRLFIMPHAHSGICTVLGLRCICCCR